MPSAERGERRRSHRQAETREAPNRARLPRDQVPVRVPDHITLDLGPLRSADSFVELCRDQSLRRAKRTSGHAALDDSMRASSDDSPESSHETAPVYGVRHLKPIPKRAKLQPARAVSPEWTVRQSESPPRPSPSPVISVDVPLFPGSSPSMLAQSGLSAYEYWMRKAMMASRMGEEAANYDEHSQVEGVHADHAARLTLSTI